jgi:hypothetical protein
MVSTRRLNDEEITYYIDMLFYDLGFLLPDDILPIDRKLIYDTVNDFRDSDDRDELYTDAEITDVLTRIEVKHGGRKSRKNKKKRSKTRYLKKWMMGY